ncbi:MAG: hypothetical protein WDO19_13170 [Bacteroidota bacterium]
MITSTIGGGVSLGFRALGLPLHEKSTEATTRKNRQKIKDRIKDSTFLKTIFKY